MIEDLVDRIRQQVAEDLASPGAAGLTGDDRREYARQRLYVHLDRTVGAPHWEHGPGSATDGLDVGARETARLTVDDEERLVTSVLDALFGLGRLQRLIDDPDVENVDVNGCDRPWVTRADGSKQLASPVADDDDGLVEVIRSAAARFGLSERRFDVGRPELDLQLPDGSRLSAVMSVTGRPAISIRRHRFTDLDLDDLVALGAMDVGLRSLLGAAVRARKNIIVTGAMNAGKTTMLRALAAEIHPRERIVTIEQSFELGLDSLPHRHPDLVAMEARPANTEGEGRITVADLVRRALRMNADRVIVGEVLGDEILPMLNAMSQGRSGSMCTIHAESSAGAFRRIASYAAQAPERLSLEASNLLVAGAVHLVVHLDTEMHDTTDPDPARPTCDDRTGPCAFPARPRRARFVASVREVVDAEGSQIVSNEIYRPGPDRRAQPSAPLRPETVDELCRFGYDPASTAPAVVW